MVDDILSWPEFLPELKSEYLTGTPEDKEKIIQQLDFEKLNQETFALVTSHLERKGCLKRSKGFGAIQDINYPMMSENVIPLFKINGNKHD